MIETDSEGCVAPGVCCATTRALRFSAAAEEAVGCHTAGRAHALPSVRREAEDFGQFLYGALDGLLSRMAI